MRGGNMTKSMYDIIKRQNGEAFAKAIRQFDSGIFEVENLPRIVRYAGRDAEPVLTYLASLKPKKTERKDFSTAEDLFQLAEKAGYKVIYADSLEKQNSIQDLFALNEGLCTFKDSNRFKNYHIFHLIKEGAEKLNRADFYGKEEREDAYGTSVLSIQISKQGGFIKICNRYNHTVENPDNTFYSNPDKIIDGMTLAIEKFLGEPIKCCKWPVPDCFVSLNGCLYRYYLEDNNIYVGEDFYIKKNELFLIHKDYQTIVDCFLVDFKKNEINLICNEACFSSYYSRINEANLFPLIQEEVKTGRLNPKKEGDLTVICLDGRPILKARNGLLTYIHLTKPEKLTDRIFEHHDTIEEVYLDNLKDIGNICASYSFSVCPNLKVLSLPKLKWLENDSVKHLPTLEKLDLSSVQEIGYACLSHLDSMQKISLPQCEELGHFSLSYNKTLQSISLPKVSGMVDNAIKDNPLLEEIAIPLLEEKLSNISQENIEYFKIGEVWPKKIKSNNLSKIQDKGGRIYD